MERNSESLSIVRRLRRALAISVLVSGALANGQATQPLTIETTNLGKAYVREAYWGHLEVRGGTPPYKWEVTEGSLPEAIVLQRDGQLTGTPTATGEFRFTATVTDGGQSPYQRAQQFLMRVVSPLMARWGKYPKINGQRLEGSILVSNETDGDFDLTMIALAVNEPGRATAIGYQHFSLKKNVADMELPFGDNLAAGSYQLNVDVVAEIPATHSIQRVRLVPKERLQIQPVP